MVEHVIPMKDPTIVSVRIDGLGKTAKLVNFCFKTFIFNQGTCLEGVVGDSSRILFSYFSIKA